MDGRTPTKAHPGKPGVAKSRAYRRVGQGRRAAEGVALHRPAALRYGSAPGLSRCRHAVLRSRRTMRNGREVAGMRWKAKMLDLLVALAALATLLVAIAANGKWDH